MHQKNENGGVIKREAQDPGNMRFLQENNRIPKIMLNSRPREHSLWIGAK